MAEPADYDLYAKDRAKNFAAKKNLVHAYIEKPAMYALLPELAGKSVLCVGCGTGEECAELSGRGAQVTGIDISAVSIAYALEHVADVTFKVVDMDSAEDLMALGKGQFDFIYSSLTLHYSNDLKATFKNLNSLLKPDGMLLFSAGHPLRWAADTKQEGDVKTVLMGYRQFAGQVEVFGNYLATTQFTQQLSDGPQVTYWMRPVSAYFDLLKTTGYVVREFKEPAPTTEALKVDKVFWDLRTKLPVDLIFLAQKIRGA